MHPSAAWRPSPHNYLPTGQWKPVTAYRKNVKGVLEAPAFLMWNVEKV